MKSPEHIVPSGDRAVARAIIAALKQAGHDVVHVSEFQSRDGLGKIENQKKLLREAEQEIDKIKSSWQKTPKDKPDLWLSYHHYYKDPDLLGYQICKIFSIPYVIAEASCRRLERCIFQTQQNADWSCFYQKKIEALRCANGIIHFNMDDVEALQPFINDDTQQCFIRPFLKDKPLFDTYKKKQSSFKIRSHAGINADQILLIGVGMMRTGDKVESWRILARVLSHFVSRSFSKVFLLIVGDGQKKNEVMRQFKAKQQSIFMGEVSQKELSQLYMISDLLIWPAVNEAYGMALLEAQAYGVSVLSVRRKGIENIVHHPVTAKLVRQNSVFALTNALRASVKSKKMLKKQAKLGAMRARRLHTKQYAAKRLERFLNNIMTQN
ncbi:MAG: glycosyltransferase family 4 protein [Pseudomonadota bacterium]